MESKLETLQSENKRLRDEIAVYQREQEEAQRKIVELEGMVKELKLKALDPSECMEWDGDTVLQWILSSEEGRFKPYENVLRHNLKQEKVSGAHLKAVEAEDVKGWGIKPLHDKKALIRHIRDLVAQKGDHGQH